MAESQTEPPPSPIEITYCDIATSEICLISFGYADTDEMLITFAIRKPVYQKTTLMVMHNNKSYEYPCEPLEAATDRIFCSGKSIPLNELIDITVFSKNGMALARGAFVTDLDISQPITSPTPTQSKAATPIPASTSTTPLSYPADYP
ncbi:MAG: hypothetical protein Kow002_14100 [Anaerolineales bacterium]